MNVLVVTNMYPMAEHDAFGAVVRDQVEDLRARGVQVDVLTILGRERRSAYLRAAARLRHVLGATQYAVVHAHYGLSGAVAITQRRVPVVTTFHGSDLGYVRWQRWISWVVARASTPVVVAPLGRARLGLPDAHVIPCGVDTETFAPIPREEARRRLGWSVEGPYALLPGSPLNPVKRADLFGAAVAEARSILPSIQERTLEGLSREQVALVMNAVDVTVVTSDSEGAPVSVKESLAVGTPVVSVEVGDVPQLIAELPGCAIVERSPRALGTAIVAALAEVPRDELRERVLPFARPAIAARLLELYEEVSRR
jgi:teichuronic acid biosynthesis glycosyltransferase TuaC